MKSDRIGSIGQHWGELASSPIPQDVPIRSEVIGRPGVLSAASMTTSPASLVRPCGWSGWRRRSSMIGSYTDSPYASHVKA